MIQPAQEVDELLDEGYTDVVDGDRSKYCATIPYSERMQCLARRIVDEHLFETRRRYRGEQVGKKRVRLGRDRRPDPGRENAVVDLRSRRYRGTTTVKVAEQRPCFGVFSKERALLGPLVGPVERAALARLAASGFSETGLFWERGFFPDEDIGISFRLTQSRRGGSESET